MNKVRIIGIGLISTGFLSNYLISSSDVFIFSGMLIGLGIGWTITGKVRVKARNKEIKVETK